MTFSTEQKTELAKPLDRKHVKPPPKGKYGEYVEGWHVIAEANRIFGFDGWTRETVSMIETNRELLDLTGSNGPYQQWRVGYVAKVRVTAGGIIREGTGFGSGMGAPVQLGEAIESAVKEAETDAMKRALMTFGYPFGLALYDKSKANVADVEAEKAREDAAAIVSRHVTAIRSATTKDALRKAYSDALDDKKAGRLPNIKDQQTIVAERNAALERIEAAEKAGADPATGEVDDDVFPGDLPTDPTAQFDRMEREHA